MPPAPLHSAKRALELVTQMRAHAGGWQNDSRRVASCDGWHQRLLRGLASQCPVATGLAGLHEVHDDVGYRALMDNRHADLSRIIQWLLRDIHCIATLGNAPRTRGAFAHDPSLATVGLKVLAPELGVTAASAHDEYRVCKR